ncbi:TPA: hypothetical protein DCE37_21630 [Candidatus Latescibacteria bacterium]|nr:hypothetical protein [Candidatus Latescibacterota bacterium]
MTVTVDVTDDRLFVHGPFNFANLNTGHTRERLLHLYHASNGIPSWRRKAEEEARKDRWKELEKQPITDLSNNDMLVLFEQDLYESKKDEDAASVGYFSWVPEEERNLEVMNNGNN